MEFTIILSRKKSLLLKVFILFLYSLTTDEIPSPFTKVPPSVLYLVSGQDARMVWDYNVNNKSAEFGSYSPAWYYYRNTTKIQIASEHKWSDPKWQWKIAPTCPDSLKDRISKESTATLVISNVNMTDTGIYECGLTFISGLYSYSRATLTVTVPPTFLSSLPNKTYQIVEGQDLKINCTATGPPTPNITWVNITDDSVAIKSQGSGSAVLQIDDTKRYHAGVYECQAKNNPNENATTIRTSVIVYYKPSIFKEGSSLMLSSWNGRQTTLNCTVVDGKPTPTITWYTPSGHQITTAVTPAAKGSRVVITTSKSADYGLYKCKATNIAGSDERNITVTQLFLPGAPNVTILNQDIQASSVTVRWTKPGYDGGSPVIDYKVQINSTKPPQEHNTTEHKTHHEFTGLTKNTRYEVRVYSRNVVGHGNASITIFSTKKRGPPPLPNLDLFQSKTAITLFWKKPDENGGPIKNYTIYRKRGVETTWTSIHVVRDLSNLTYVIQLKDLEPGQTYWFIVTATNEFGESEKGSDEGKKANPYILSTALTPTPPTTTESAPNENEHKVGGGDKASPVVIAGAVGAVVLFLVAAVIIVIILRKKNILGRGPIKSTRSDRAAYHNDIDHDNVTQHGAAVSLGGVDDGIPTYAAVDVSKKKKKNEQDGIPNYAVVDKGKKKRPGEIIYAELADFKSPGTAVEAPRPITYAGTDYADITQFQKQDEPEPTYANFSGKSKGFTNIQDK